MTNRVLVGKNGSAYEALISKPGVSVTSASDEQMLLSSRRKSFQILDSGFVTLPANTKKVQVTIGSYGYRPLVLVSSTNASLVATAGVAFLNNTTIEIYLMSGFNTHLVTRSTTFRYVVMAMRLPSW